MSNQIEESDRIARMLLRLFEHWQLNRSQQLELMGISGVSDANLSEYLQGGNLVNDRDMMERASILLGIHKSLRLLFPQNRELVYQWFSCPNKGFNGLAPLEVIDQQGMLGMYIVHSYLEHKLSGED